MTTDEPIAYGDAIAELEAIVAALEDADVDVDVLARRVARAAELITLCRDRIANTRIEVAAELITLCRDRIANTRIEVERIVADLEPPA